MSELHTLRSQVENYEDRVQAYEDAETEREYEIARLEAERAATQESLERMHNANEIRIQRQEQININLSLELKEVKTSYENNVNKLRTDSLSELNKINTSFEAKIAETKKTHSNDLNKLKDVTKKLISEHKAAIDSTVTVLNTSIKSLNIDVESIKKQLSSKNKNKKVFVENAIKNLINLYKYQETDSQSTLKHPDAKPDSIDWLPIFKNKIENFKLILAMGIDETELDHLFIKVMIDLNSFEEKLLISDNKAEEIRSKFTSLVARFDALIKHGESNRRFKISKLKAEDSFKRNSNEEPWPEVKEDIEEEINFWLKGEYDEKLTSRSSMLSELKKINYLHSSVTKEFLESMEVRVMEYESDFRDMRKKTRDMAVNSNLRLLQAYRTFQMLTEKFGAEEMDISFEKDDPRSRVHLNCKVNGYNRHFIFGIDDENPSSINFTASSGVDHAQPFAELEVSEGEFVTKFITEELNLKGKDGSSPQVVRKSSGICSNVKEFKNGMTQEQVEITNQN
jgi:hypothetical protein